MNLIVAFDTDAPSGWAECDGTQGTPDITGRFIMGGGLDSFSGGIPPPYTTGGEATHLLSLDEMPEHEHLFSTTKYTVTVHTGNYVSCVLQSPTPPKTQFTTKNDTYTQKAVSLMPPYKVVVFAMRNSNSSSDSLPVGSIIWYYPVASIPTPSGWKKYDAQQRFLLGRKKGLYALGTTGGATEIVLDYTHLPLHQHSYDYPYYGNNVNNCEQSTDISCPDFNVINKPNNEVPTSAAGSNTPSSIPILPPYRLFYCIQKTDKSVDIPVGAICAWANKDGKTQIPTGWVICDTTNNSPDLRGHFVYTDNTNIVGSGGTNSIELTSNHLPSHSHFSNYYKYPPGYNLCDSWGSFSPDKQDHNVSDTSSPTEQVKYTSGIVSKSATQKTLQTIPPYIVLLYIMKVF